jgi:aminocarboxymuconate-semialdehyde decarboxylase
MTEKDCKGENKMPKPLAIDAHAHILTEETMKLLASETPKVAPKLTPIDRDVFELSIAGVPYRPFPLGGFDIAQRLKDMAASEVDMQVLSNTPQTFLYNQEAGLTTASAMVQNDQIAKHVRDHPERFYGLATLPMQAARAAADELSRAITKLGLKGAQIGSNIMGKNLDEPEFEPVWQVANKHSAIIMVHPNNVAGADRLKNYYLGNLIGNPLDTTIAAACLVFGGVIARYPNIRFFMVHGGGFAPYQAGRWQHAWHVRPEPKKNLKEPPADVIRTFYWDTILHGMPALEYLASAFGADHVILGSDYPYDMGTFECARQVKALSIADADKATILGGLVQQLLAAVK